MKKIMITIALFSSLITGCGKSEPDRDLNTRTPEEQATHEQLYKGLETPVDRSRSKEY